MSPEATGSTIAVSLDVPETAVPGVRLPLTLVVSNPSPQPTDVAFGGDPPHDFVIEAADGREVWRWTHGAVTRDVLLVRRLDAREAFSLGGEWDQRDNDGRTVPAGTYRVRGMVRVEGGWITTETRSVVVSPP